MLTANPNFEVHMPRKHRSDDAGWQFADAINDVILDETRGLLASADFFSITVDASAAVDNTDYMNIEVRFWHDGSLRLAFICMKAIGMDPSAKGQKKTMLH
jgi:hypothetical protein